MQLQRKSPARCGVSETVVEWEKTQRELITSLCSLLLFPPPFAQCSAEYTGQKCSACAATYYMLGGKCYFCGESADQSRTIQLTAAVAVGAMVVLSVAVAYLSARSLAQTIQVFVVLQSIVTVGVEGAKSIPLYAEQVSYEQHTHTPSSTRG